MSACALSTGHIESRQRVLWRAQLVRHQERSAHRSAEVVRETRACNHFPAQASGAASWVETRPVISQLKPQTASAATEFAPQRYVTIAGCSNTRASCVRLEDVGTAASTDAEEGEDRRCSRLADAAGKPATKFETEIIGKHRSATTI